MTTEFNKWLECWQEENSIKVDCNTCANRGQVDGLSQETHCDHCKWQERWRTDHYLPKA